MVIISKVINTFKKRNLNKIKNSVTYPKVTLQVCHSHKCPLTTILYSVSRPYSRLSKVFYIDIEDSICAVEYISHDTQSHNHVH